MKYVWMVVAVLALFVGTASAQDGGIYTDNWRMRHQAGPHFNGSRQCYCALVTLSEEKTPTPGETAYYIDDTGTEWEIPHTWKAPRNPDPYTGRTTDDPTRGIWLCDPVKQKYKGLIMDNNMS